MSNSTSIGLVDSFVKLNWNFQSQEAAGILIEIFIRYECFNTYPQTHVSIICILYTSSYMYSNNSLKYACMISKPYVFCTIHMYAWLLLHVLAMLIT